MAVWDILLGPVGAIGLAVLLTPGLLILLFTFVRCQSYPEKNFYNNFLNVALTPVRWLGLGPFKQGKINLDKAMKYAIKKAKLSDFGDTSFVEAYAALADSKVSKSLQLSNLGYITHQLEMNMTMVRRLKMREYVKNHPEILKIPVRSPVFVLGLPRTGTTFLHRLLSLDPAVRSPLLWELLAYVPLKSGKDGDNSLAADNEKRAKAIRKMIKMRRDMGDYAIDHIHETDADLPEECVWAMSDELPVHMSFLYSIYCDYKNFITKVTEAHKNRAYDYYRVVLQLLSYQIGERGAVNGSKEPRRWMLKSPMHMFMIPQIAHSYPDAKIIWTHRHPVSAVPSMCSLVKSLHQLYYENECRDDAMIGREIAKVSGELLNECPKQITAGKLDCINSVYEDLIKDPIGTVKNIYRQFGWEFTSEYESILLNYLSENAKKREEKKRERQAKGDKLHTYTPEEFSLTTGELSSGLFKEYVERYNVPMSHN